MSTSKVHINNTYIKCTFVEVASLLIYQVFEAVPLPVTVPLIEALRLGFGFLGFFTGAATSLPFMKFPFLPFPFFETSGLVNHQHLMLLLDFYLCGLKHDEQLRDHLPLHVIVLHETLVAW